MILNHLAGTDKRDELKAEYPVEIECICLNSNFEDISDLINMAINLQKQYPERVVLKESEFHEEDEPYYEISLYCDLEEVTKYSEIIKKFGLQVDIIHK